MEIKQLQTFLTVARLLNFTAAAETLNYSQSTISDHIRNLEEDIGVKLFERLGRKVFLSEDGKKLIALAEKLVKNAEEINDLFSNDGKVRGTLRIGAAETLCVFWLPPLLKQYRVTYPEVQVTLKMADCLEFREMLEQNLIDVAFSFHNESQQKHLSQTDLFEDFAILVAAPSYPLSKVESNSIHHLENQAFIFPEAGCSYRIMLERFLQCYGVKLGSIMELGSLEAIKQCVKSGLGISLLPAIAVNQEITSGELIPLSIEICPIPIQAKMVYHKEKWISPQLAVLKEMVLLKKSVKGLPSTDFLETTI